MQRLRAARSCYDHLAGRLGVSVTEALVHRGMLAPAAREFDVTAHGERFFATIGVDVEAVRSRKRTLARSCLDWTERRPHLAGSLGAALLERTICAGWIARAQGNRALIVTALGERELPRVFGVSL
jgi:hypothetical protein